MSLQNSPGESGPFNLSEKYLYFIGLTYMHDIIGGFGWPLICEPGCSMLMTWLHNENSTQTEGGFPYAKELTQRTQYILRHFMLS